MPAMEMDHEIDPKAKIIADVGDLFQVEIFNNQILVGVYLRPQKTKSGLYLTDKHVDEDRYQSKVGVLLKKGAAAFADDSGEWFHGETFALGDWLVFRPSDGWNITVNGVLCRMMTDTQVRGRVNSPDKVW